jgi:hypothetical protein
VVSFGPNPTTKYITTTYFRATFQATAVPATLTLGLLADDGAVAYVNGVEVARDNMPSGAVGPTTPATVGLSTRSEETTPVTFHLSPGVLAPGSNTIAVEVHQANAWSADLSFRIAPSTGADCARAQPYTQRFPLFPEPRCRVAPSTARCRLDGGAVVLSIL